MANDRSVFWDSLPAQYGIPIAFMAACALGLFFLGDQPSLIVMKTAAVSLYFIASRGVGAIFTSAASRTLWTPVYIERQFIESLIFVCWLTIFLWRPDISATRIVVIFLLGTVAMTLVRVLLDALSFKRKAPR
jgi:riboflavin transporter FmnP